MCVVIDMNRLSTVFNNNNRESANFRRLREWILEGPGFLVYGGSRYSNELSEGCSKLIKELKNQSYKNVVVLRDDIVDNKESEIGIAFPYAFNLDNEKNDGDPFIVAICIVSKTKIVCTNDKRCKDAIESVFTKNRPRLYSSDKNADLLKPDNVVKIPKSKIKN
jgi:hypothetical protein